MPRLQTIRRPLSVILGIVVSMLSLFVPLNTLAAPPFQANPPVTLAVAMPAPTSLDPVSVSRFDPGTHDLVENLFVGLTRFDPMTQQIEPMLAKEWAVSPDGLTWTFQLRDDIQWVGLDSATGSLVAIRPVVAGDFVYAIQRGCDPLRPSPLTTNLMIVRGCQTVANAFPEVITDLFIAREIGVRATGPTTLEIDLRFPAGYLPTLLAEPEFRALPREAITAQDDWTNITTILTNGPYALQSQTDSGLSLVRNPYWPDPFSGNIEQIDVVFTPEEDIASLVAAGRADIAYLAPDSISSASAAYPDLLHVTEGTTLVLLGYSFEQPLMAAPEMRRALALALDRQPLAALLSGYAPATQFTPAGVVAAPTTSLTGANQAAAQAALTAAGYPGCGNLPERITLTVRNDDPAWLQLGEAVTAQWSAVLGCNPALFTLNTAPRTTLIEMSHINYDPEEMTRPFLWLAAWSADYPDANAWLSDALHCRYGYLRVDRACDEADTLLDQAAALTDAAERANLYAQVEQLFFGPEGSFPVIPLMLTQSAWLQQPRLGGVNTSGAARYDLWTITTG